VAVREEVREAATEEEEDSEEADAEVVAVAASPVTESHSEETVKENGSQSPS